MRLLLLRYPISGSCKRTSSENESGTARWFNCIRHLTFHHASTHSSPAITPGDAGSASYTSKRNASPCIATCPDTHGRHRASSRADRPHGDISKGPHDPRAAIRTLVREGADHGRSRDEITLRLCDLFRLPGIRMQCALPHIAPTARLWPKQFLGYESIALFPRRGAPRISCRAGVPSIESRPAASNLGF